jgi:hypothetical protein
MATTPGLVAFLFATAGDPACAVTLINSSGVDLSLPMESRDLVLGPSDSATVPITSLSSLDFGAVNHRFLVSPALPALCSVSRPVEVEARSDGQLWIRGVDKQPDGMPLKPTQLQDLTGSPPNNSFKPNPLRGSA